MSDATNNNDSRSVPDWVKPAAGILLPIFAIAVLLHILAAPLFQPLIYELVRQSPIIVFYYIPALVLGTIIAAIGTKLGYDNATTYAKYFIIGIFVFATLIVVPLSGIAGNEALADRTEQKMSTTTLGENSQSLPQLDSENMRNVPLKKAKVDANNNFQQSKFRLSDDADITYVNGEPYWSFANVPDASGEKWSGAQAGSTFVSQTNSDGKVYVVEGDIKNGLGVQPWRSNKWNLQRTNYWVQYKDPFMSVQTLPESGGTVKGETKIVRPLITHEYHFKWGIIPYTLPTFQGAAVQDSDGNVEYLSPSEIRNNEELSDDNVYPYDLAMQEVTSLNWRQGFINHFWFKNGLFKIAEPTEDYGNSLPYTVQGADGSKDYYIPVSPQGSGDGLKHIFIMDGQTGELEQFKTGEKRMVGSQNIGKYVQGETPPQVTTWEEFRPVEPLPVVHNDNLFWQVRILPTDGTGMPGYAFINASEPSDIRFAMGDNKDELAEAFARGESIEDQNGVTKNESQTTVNGSTVTQIVVKQNGETVGKFNVTQDTTVEFEVRSTNSTNSTDISD